MSNQLCGQLNLIIFSNTDICSFIRNEIDYLDESFLWFLPYIRESLTQNNFNNHIEFLKELHKYYRQTSLSLLGIFVYQFELKNYLCVTKIHFTLRITDDVMKEVFELPYYYILRDNMAMRQCRICHFVIGYCVGVSCIQTRPMSLPMNSSQSNSLVHPQCHNLLLRQHDLLLFHNIH